jgi:nitrous oxide reductase accessory protein NosL
MNKALLFATILAGSALFVGCNKTEETQDIPAGATVNKEGKVLSAEELANAPKAEGAFDGVPGGPGGMKKKGGAPR